MILKVLQTFVEKQGGCRYQALLVRTKQLFS